MTRRSPHPSKTAADHAGPPIAEVAGLSFTSHDMREAGSLALLAPELTDRCGIYVLVFENGEEYVGQAHDIVERYADHRRHYDDIVELHFAPCPSDELDTFEAKMIRHEELVPFNLRNRKLTGKPGGESDLIVTMKDGRTIALPWERARRFPDGAPISKELRFWQLTGHERYADLRRVLAKYVDETLPDPVYTQGVWSLCALPGTAGGARLFTLSVGSTETIYAGNTDYGDDEPVECWVVLNISGEDGEAAKLDALSNPLISHEPAPYAIAKYHNVIRIDCESLEAATALLANDFVLDAAYRLNVTLMRQGSAPFRRHHNTPFAADVMLAAWHLGDPTEG